MCPNFIKTIGSLLSPPDAPPPPPKPPAQAAGAAHGSGGTVKLSDGSAAGGFLEGQVKLGLPDGQRKRKGVPGLGL